MADRRRNRPALLSLCLAACAVPAMAQQQAAAPAAGPITLAEGVRQSLEKARVIQLAAEDVNLQQGTVRQAKGAFDAVVTIGPSFEYREDPIEKTPFFDPERVKRGFANRLRDGFGAVANALDQQIAKGRGDLPLCPPEAGFSSYTVTLPGSAVPVPLCRPASLSLGPPQTDDANEDNSFLFRQALPFDPLSNFQLQALLAQAFRAQIATVALEARERGNELLLTLANAARIVEQRAELTAIRLGEVPESVYSTSTAFFGQFTKPLRNGSIFQFKATFDSRGTMFRDKPIDPTFGGSDVRNRFGNRLELTWIQPLMRGRGGDTVEAPERAALKNVEASRYTFQQASADQALVTAEAYFELLAAQDTLRLTRDSLTVQRRILDNTTRLVGAGEVASADIARARARTSQVESDVESARLAVVSAQTGLADAMGLPSTAMITLAASDTFPVAPYDVDDLAQLSKEALVRRSDVKAFAAFRDTSQILLAAAKAETRSRWDVRLSGGFGQSFFSPTFHSLFDENGVHVNNDLYTKYYSFAGYGRAFERRWEPIGSVVWNIELPFGNNERKGRYAQALASAKQSDIRLADLGRSIVNNVPKIVEELRQVRAEWLQRQDAVVQYEATWDAAQRLRAAGEMTLIDTLLTEQQLTDARLQLVLAKRDYATTLVRFRRETGTLLDFPEWSRALPNLAGIVATP